MIIQKNKWLLCLSVVRWGPRKETQAPSRWVLLHPDVSDSRCPEEDAAHWPQHVHPWRPGAHLSGQDTIQSGELTKYDVVEKLFLLSLFIYMYRYQVLYSALSQVIFYYDSLTDNFNEVGSLTKLIRTRGQLFLPWKILLCTSPAV